MFVQDRLDFFLRWKIGTIVAPHQLQLLQCLSDVQEASINDTSKTNNKHSSLSFPIDGVVAVRVEGRVQVDQVDTPGVHAAHDVRVVARLLSCGWLSWEGH